MALVPHAVLQLLRCPACRGPLEERDADPPGLMCVGCGRVYPMRDGIPVLLVDEAVSPGGIAR